MSGPFFSIVIPAYNRARLISRTLKSVQEQGFKDFECVIVDDGSRDSNALKEQINLLNDQRFRYFWRANGGGAAARNSGIDASRGRFIAFLDSDDEFLPGKLEQDFAFFNGPSRDDCGSFCQVLVDRGVGKLWIKPRRGPFAGENISEYLTCYQGFVPSSSLVVERGTAAAVRYDEKLPFGQDMDFAMRLAAARIRLVMLEKPLARVNDDARPDRISLQEKYHPPLEWSDRMRGRISPRAYLAFRGWHVARLAAPHDTKLAYGLYFMALLSGAFPLRLAAKAFLQIVVPRTTYRRIANSMVRLLGRH